MLISLPTNQSKPKMKRFFAILLLLLTVTTAATAQNVIVGERLPDLSLRRWLMDLEPEQTEYTCYLFYHSESELCKKALSKIKPLIDSAEWELGLVIVTKEEYEDAGVTLTEHLDDRIGVAFDLQGRAFRSLEVNFILSLIKRRVKSFYFQTVSYAPVILAFVTLG